MKRIFAIMLMVAIAASAYSQNANQRLSQLEAYLHELGYEVRHSQSNGHRGITHHWYSHIHDNGPIWMWLPWYEEDSTIIRMRNDSIRALEQQKIEKALDSIRITFALLGKEATESYTYEYHRNDTDTIKYTLAFRHDEDIKRIPQKNLFFFNTYTANAHEVATFEYDRQGDCGYGLGSGSYNHTVSTPSSFSYNDMQPFDIAAFEAQIQPVMDSFMKLKGAKAYPVYWRHDEGYEAGENELLEKWGSGIKIQVAGEPEKIINKVAGLTTGTHYVIPLRNEAEINTLLQQLNSLTYNYIEQHPDQPYYYYNFNSHISLDDEVISGPNDILKGYKHRDGDEYRLSYDTDIEEENFHLLSITTKGDYWVPRDWEKLKSYINGEKVYLKGMKPKTEE